MGGLCPIVYNQNMTLRWLFIISSLTLSPYISADEGKVNPYAPPPLVEQATPAQIAFRNAIDQDGCTAGLLVSSKERAMGYLKVTVGGLTANLPAKGDITVYVHTIQAGEKTRRVVRIKPRISSDADIANSISQHIDFEAYGYVVEETNFKPSIGTRMIRLMLSCHSGIVCALTSAPVYALSSVSLMSLLGVDTTYSLPIQGIRYLIYRLSEHFLNGGSKSAINLLTLDYVVLNSLKEIISQTNASTDDLTLFLEINPWLKSNLEALFDNDDDSVLVLFEARSGLDLGRAVQYVFQQMDIREVSMTETTNPVPPSR